MTYLYVHFTDCADCERLNELMYEHYVFDGENFIPPFMSGTTRYCDCYPHPTNSECLAFLDERMLEYAEINEEVADLIADQITFQQAYDAGWFHGDE